MKYHAVKCKKRSKTEWNLGNRTVYCSMPELIVHTFDENSQTLGINSWSTSNVIHWELIDLVFAVRGFVVQGI